MFKFYCIIVLCTFISFTTSFTEEQKANISKVLSYHERDERFLGYKLIYIQDDRIAEVLLMNGVDPNFLEIDRTTPLIQAVRMGSLSRVELLLRNDGDPLIKDNSGVSALDYACKAEETSICDAMKLKMDN